MTVSNRAPWLDPWQSAQLAQVGPWGTGEWGGIDPDEIEYGTPLPELAERYGFLDDFLEAAAVAGAHERDLRGGGDDHPRPSRVVGGPGASR